MLYVLDLFSGIGGFSLGLERAGMRTVAFCESDSDCQSVLQRHWPGVPIHGDIRSLDGTRYAGVDVVCGGFPCQPHSTASRGRRGGVEDDRFLWPEMLRIVQESRPTWVVGENVAGIEGVALEQVVSDLEACGYEVAPPLEIPACAVGRDHWRKRYWFLAYSNHQGEHGRAFNAEVAELPERGDGAGSVGSAHGIPGRMDRFRMIGNTVDTGVVQVIGEAMMELRRTKGPEG